MLRQGLSLVAALSILLTFTGVSVAGDQTERWSELDHDHDGHWNERTLHDADGRIVRHEHDVDGDGHPDASTDFVYRDQGRTVTTRTDGDGDGAVDSTTRTRYDGEGRTLQYEQDTDADGLSDSMQVFFYDGRGRRIRELIDTDGDGIWEHDTTFEPACEAPYTSCTKMPGC